MEDHRMYLDDVRHGNVMAICVFSISLGALVIAITVVYRLYRKSIPSEENSEQKNSLLSSVKSSIRSSMRSITSASSCNNQKNGDTITKSSLPTLPDIVEMEELDENKRQNWSFTTVSSSRIFSSFTERVSVKQSSIRPVTSHSIVKHRSLGCSSVSYKLEEIDGSHLLGRKDENSRSFNILGLPTINESQSDRSTSMPHSTHSNSFLQHYSQETSLQRHLPSSSVISPVLPTAAEYALEDNINRTNLNHVAVHSYITNLDDFQQNYAFSDIDLPDESFYLYSEQENKEKIHITKPKNCCSNEEHTDNYINYEEENDDAQSIKLDEN
jgi:hypothetical protein